MLRKSVPYIIPVMLLAVLLVLSSCQTEDRDQPEARSTQIIGVAGELNRSDLYGDDNAVANALYGQCHNQPELLAATISAYPTLVKNCGLNSSDALELDRMMDYDSDGGEIQAKLLAELKRMLESGQVKYDYGTCDMVCVNMLYSIATVTPGQELTPPDVNLIWVPVNMSGQRYCMITDEYGETGYFSLDMALQRFVGD